MTDQQALLWGIGLFAALMAAVLLRRVLGQLFKFTLRAALGGAVLAALSPVSASLGFHLGVNVFNMAVMGLLGAPGFGLLLLLNWLVR